MDPKPDALPDAAPPAQPQAELSIDVVYAEPHLTLRRSLQLKSGATVADALRTAELPQADSALQQHFKVGVYGRLVDLAHTLCDQDRVEIYRPLLADPKESRRQRAAKKK